MIGIQHSVAQVRTNSDTVNQQAFETAKFKALYMDALKYKMLEMPERAINNFADCLQIDSTSSAVLQQLGIMHMVAGEYNEAEHYFTDAVKYNPSNNKYVESLIKYYALTKQPLRAAQTYNKLSYDDKDDELGGKLRQVDLYMQGRDYESAEQTLDNILKQEPDLAEAVLAKANLYMVSGNKKQAEKYLEKKISKEPGNTKYLEGLMNLYSRENNESKFVETAERILEVDSNNPNVCYWLAGYYADKKAYDKSVEYSLKVIENPDIPFGLKSELARAFIARQGDRGISGASHFSRQQQETLVNKLIESNPQEAEGYSLLATLNIYNSNLAEAESALEKSLDIEPGNYQDWTRLMLIYNQNNDMDKLVSVADKVSELFPSQPLPILLKGYALYEKKDFQAVIDMVDMDLFVDADMKSQAMMLIADSYEKLGELDKSHAQYESILKFNPNDIMVKNNYAYSLSQNEGDLRKAEKMSAATIEQDARNSTYLDTYAWILFKQKKYSLAKYYIESCINNLKEGEESGVIYEHYGDILYMNEDPKGAVEQWQKAKQIGGDVSDKLDEKIVSGKFIE